MKWHFPQRPFEVQIKALEWAKDREGAGFGLEQGMGKTRIALNEFFNLREEGKARRCLIVAPNSFKDDWRIEAEGAGLGIPIYVHESGKTNALLGKFMAENEEWIAVFNPEAILTTLFEANIKKLTGKDTYFVWDESIKLKNYKGSTTRAAHKLSKLCRYTRALSGKLTTQGPHDLWGQLRFIKKAIDVNFFQFRNRYCVMGGFSGWQVIGTRNEEELQRNLAECFFIARKKDWLDLPEKIYLPPRKLEMLPGQKAKYKQMEKDFFYEMTEEKLSVAQVVTRNMKLHQIKSGFIYDEAGKVVTVVEPELNPRIQFIRQYLDEEVVGKLIVVALFKPSIDWLGSSLADYGVVKITGGMSKQEVGEAKAKFNGDDNVRVIILQQQAAKYGHTLLGTEKSPCSSMLFYEQSYSLDDRSQIEDRNHRIGQSHTCVYLDISMSSLDNEVIRALQRKEDVAACVMRYGREHGLLPHALARTGKSRPSVNAP